MMRRFRFAAAALAAAIMAQPGPTARAADISTDNAIPEPLERVNLLRHLPGEPVHLCGDLANKERASVFFFADRHYAANGPELIAEAEAALAREEDARAREEVMRVMLNVAASRIRLADVTGDPAWLEGVETTLRDARRMVMQLPALEEMRAFDQQRVMRLVANIMMRAADADLLAGVLRDDPARLRAAARKYRSFIRFMEKEGKPLSALRSYAWRVTAEAEGSLAAIHYVLSRLDDDPRDIDLAISYGIRAVRTFAPGIRPAHLRLAQINLGQAYNLKTERTGDPSFANFALDMLKETTSAMDRCLPSFYADRAYAALTNAEELTR